KAACERVAEAKKKRAFADRLELLRDDLARMSNYNDRKRFAKIILRSNVNGDRLARGLKAWFGRKPRGYVAHHMMPREFRHEFAAWGFDVDDYRDGRGVYVLK